MWRVTRLRRNDQFRAVGIPRPLSGAIDLRANAMSASMRSLEARVYYNYYYGYSSLSSVVLPSTIMLCPDSKFSVSLSNFPFPSRSIHRPASLYSAS